MIILTSVLCVVTAFILMYLTDSSLIFGLCVIQTMALVFLIIVESKYRIEHLRFKSYEKKYLEKRDQND